MDHSPHQVSTGQRTSFSTRNKIKIKSLKNVRSVCDTKTKSTSRSLSFHHLAPKIATPIHLYVFPCSFLSPPPPLPSDTVQDAMQRAGLLPLHFFMRGRSESATRFLDLACGTGRYLTFVRDNYPHMKLTGVRTPPPGPLFPPPFLRVPSSLHPPHFHPVVYWWCNNSWIFSIFFGGYCWVGVGEWTGGGVDLFRGYAELEAGMGVCRWI